MMRSLLLDEAPGPLRAARGLERTMAGVAGVGDIL